MKHRASLLIIAFFLATMLSPLVIKGAQATTCPSPCTLAVMTNVSTSDATVNVIAKGFPTAVGLPHTYTFGNGTVNWVKVQNTNFTGSSGAWYRFTQWTLNGAQWDTSPNMTTPLMVYTYSFEATFRKLLPLTMTFVDQTGQTVRPPTSVTLTSSKGIAVLTWTNSTVNDYTNHWLDAAVWTVSSATWQGVQEDLGAQTTPQTIDLTNSPANTAVTVQAYDAKMHIVDASNHPVSGATVSVTLPNGTQTYTFTSDSQGYVDLGLLPSGVSYTANVSFQNQSYGPYAGDPATEPVKTVQLSSVGGSTTTPLVSSFVLLIIFGLALFLIFLAIRVRKPPPPPMIG